MEMSLGRVEKKFGAEQVVMLLCQIEVLMAQGNSTPVACRDLVPNDVHIVSDMH